MDTLIKEEPIEINENEAVDSQENYTEPNKNENLIDKIFESELVYLKKMSDGILKDDDISLELLPDVGSLVKLPNKETQNKDQLSINDLIYKMNNNKNLNQKSILEKKFDDNFLRLQREQIDLEKKKILNSLLESAKEKPNLDTRLNKYEPMNTNEENRVLKKLNLYIENHKSTDHQLNQLRTKLNLRNLKRKNRVKLFDIDSYVNELIDQEKMKMVNLIRQNKVKPQINQPYDQIYEFDDDIIFESASLQTSNNSEIIEISRVLDRFNNKKTKLSYHETCHYALQSRIGIVEERNDDIKCIISPYTSQILKPYVWRDSISLPIKLKLHKEIIEKLSEKFERSSIDYVHLRPEHVIQINMMCRQHFWNGIDISECLDYPDYTIVALYKKLIVAFAFLVPNKSLKEAYLSFILVHPDWRSAKTTSEKDTSVSIAQYMMFYLIQKCSDFDITLHVSVNSPVVVFYQKFGFEIIEYIKNFYDKYYSDEQNLSKDAFLMKLSKN